MCMYVCMYVSICVCLFVCLCVCVRLLEMYTVSCKLRCVVPHLFSVRETSQIHCKQNILKKTLILFLFLFLFLFCFCFVFACVSPNLEIKSLNSCNYKLSVKSVRIERIKHFFYRSTKNMWAFLLRIPHKFLFLPCEIVKHYTTRYHACENKKGCTN